MSIPLFKGPPSNRGENETSKRLSASSFDLLTPLPFGSPQSRPRGWSPVRFEGKRIEGKGSREEDKGKKEGKQGTKVSETTSTRFSVGVPWRVTKARSNRNGEAPSTTIPLAVVAPMNSVVRKEEIRQVEAPKAQNFSSQKNSLTKEEDFGKKASRSFLHPTDRPESKSSRVEKPSCGNGDVNESNSKQFRQASPNTVQNATNILSHALRTRAKDNLRVVSSNPATNIPSKERNSDIPGSNKIQTCPQNKSQNQPAPSRDSKSSQKGIYLQPIPGSNAKSVSVNQNKVNLISTSSKDEPKRPSQRIVKKSPSSTKNSSNPSAPSPGDLKNERNRVSDSFDPNPECHPVSCPVEPSPPSWSSSKQTPPSSLEGLSKPKFEAWFKEIQQSKSSPSREKPIWTREKTSPLHSQIEKTKNFYNDIAVATQKRRASSLDTARLSRALPEKKKEENGKDFVRPDVVASNPDLSRVGSSNPVKFVASRGMSIEASKSPGGSKDATTLGQTIIPTTTTTSVSADVTLRLPRRPSATEPPQGGWTSVDVEVSGSVVIQGGHEDDSLSESSSLSSSSSDGYQNISSVHRGQGRGVGPGGVMDDGGYSNPLPHPPHMQAPLGLVENPGKAQSLPGFYKRPSSPPQSFRDAFTASYSPSARRRPVQHPQPYPGNYSSGRTSQVYPKDPPVNEKERPKEEKKSKRFLGGLFRRRRKDSSSSSSDSEDANGPRRKFFSRREKKKDGMGKKETAIYSDVNPPPPPRDTVGVSVSAHHYGQQTTYLLTTDTGKVLKMSPTGSLGRDVSSHYAMEGQSFRGLKGPHLNLGRPGVSASHDSLAASESAYGSINSSQRSSALGRSSSTDTLSRKEKREVLKARVEKLRDRTKGSSSEEEGASLSSQFGSESSLTKGDSFRRTRSSRTERYIRRKAQELETLRIETEKDRKNREAVQARILEIQKTQKAKQDKKGCKEEAKGVIESQVPKRTAQLIYQDVNQYNSVVIPNPPNSVAPTPRAPSRHQYVVKRLSDISDVRPGQVPYGAYGHGIPPTSSLDRPKPGMENLSSLGVMQQQRSISYDSNINKASSLPPQYINRTPVPYSSLSPPAPPPRDSSSLLSPYEFHRPISYSFENLNQPHSFNGYIPPNPPRRTPIPPSRIEPQPSVSTRGFTNPCCRSFSEKHLNHASPAYSSLPSRPALPKGYNPEEMYNNQLQTNGIPPVVTHGQYSPRPPTHGEGPAFSSGKASQYGKLLVPNIAPSPSSDYSSYVSDNSFLQPHQSFGSQEIERQPTPSMRPDSPKPAPLKEPFLVPKSRPSVLQQRPVECHASPSTQSDIPTTASHKAGKIDDSDSGSNKDQGKSASNQPLALPSEKSESGSKNSPHSSPSQKPRPPKRNSSSSIEFFKQHFESMMNNSMNRGDAQESIAACQEKVTEFFLKEKERLEQSKNANFEEALNELETIYKNLNLQSEDILEGAEKMERLDETKRKEETRETSRGRSRTPKSRSSSTPDATKDDLHLRRVQLNNRNLPDTKKALENTGSYLLVSPLHGPPSIESRDASLDREPDIITDDVTVRNVQRANAMKVLDPQPPFGIPLGPIPAGVRSDYLNSPPSSSTSPSKTGPNKEPDIVTDDLAFRSLRKENDAEKSSSNKSLNVMKLDELIAEYKIPRGVPRSKSVPRSSSVDRFSTPQAQKQSAQTPRKIKHNLKSKRGARFCDSFKEALTDGEGSSGSSVWRQNPSWVERANLSDSKWGNVSTSTETLTEIASAKASSQPDIRQAILREAKFPSAIVDENDESPISLFEPFEAPSVIPPPPPMPTTFPPPQILRVQTVPNVPMNQTTVENKVDGPLQSHLNKHPKPFSYLTPNPPPKSLAGGKTNPVDVATLDELIHSLSNMESRVDSSSNSSPKNKSKVENTCTETMATSDTVDKPSVTSIGFEEARNKIETAIRNSIATSESSSNEGNRLKRRFSDVEPPGPDFPLNQSRPSAVMSMDITCKHFPSPSTPERVTVDESLTPSSSACQATTLTNKVPTMIVSSENVENKDGRAQSVPSNSSSLPLSPPNVAQKASHARHSSAPVSLVKPPVKPQEGNIAPLDSESSSSSPSFESSRSSSPDLKMSLIPAENVLATEARGPSNRNEVQTDDHSTPSSSSPPGEIMRCVALPQTFREQGRWQRYFVAFCYVLVALIHISGFELLTAVSLIMAVASVVITFAS